MTYFILFFVHFTCIKLFVRRRICLNNHLPPAPDLEKWPTKIKCWYFFY